MSGYRDDRRRSGRDDHGSDRRRERSPERRDRNSSYGRRDYEDRAAQYGQGTGDGGRGGFRGRGGYRGSDRGGYDQRSDRGGYNQRSSSRVQSSLETLPDLPEVVPRPPNGGALTLSDLPLKGTLGRLVRIAVNHFVILSLPIVKV